MLHVNVGHSGSLARSRATLFANAVALAAALIVAFVLALGAPRSLLAQVGSSTDIITGTVLGPNGAPVAGAQVQVTSIETGVSRNKTTDEKGRYTLLFPDGGGHYRVTARRIGFAPRDQVVARVADEDRLVANFSLSASAQQLSTVQVQARPTPRRAEDERPTPGSTARTLSGDQLLRLPIDPSDPNAVALLAPGVVGLTGSDTSAAGFSVAGQRPDQNQVTLDGLTFEAATVPPEAVRSTRVVTNTYDIARGQFTGGVVQTTTRGGTNDLAGSLGFSLRDPRLELENDTSTGAFNTGMTQHQFSGGIGGPIVPDKLFYFVSGQWRRQFNPLQSLLGADSRTLLRLGTSPDSAQRFLDLLGTYGLPATVSRVPDDRLSDNLSGITRVDWTASENHQLTLRGNVQQNSQRGFRTSALAVPSFGGEQDGSGWGVMSSLSSTFGTVLNEARASLSRDNSSGDPYLLLPDGRVRVNSLLENGSTSISTLSFGGNPGLPTQGRNTVLEMTDELSLLQFNGHRYKLGGLLNFTSFNNIANNNRYGTFTFNSLADFTAGQPSSFTRTLSSRVREGSALNGAIYLGDTWRKSRALQITYGARAEYSDYLGRPAYNPLVEQQFGVRTDRFPREFHASPRIGFSYTMGLPAPGQAGPGGGDGGGFGGRGGRGGGGFQPGGFGAGGTVTTFRGGIGEFRGRAPTSLFANAIDATGLAGAQRQLVCIGGAVPTPDWAAYLSDLANVPSTCADGSAGTPGGQTATQSPTVTVFDPSFTAPRAWRSSLGVSRRFANRLSLNLDASYSLGTSLYGARDLNLHDTPYFTLASEANRPVFVPASTIVPTTGATSVLASRAKPGFAQVLEVNSKLASRTSQITAGMGGTSFRSLIWNLSYTFMRSTDESAFGTNGFAGGGSTIGNPNVPEWGTSDLERRHSVSGSTTWLARPWIDITSVLRFSAGARFSPIVGSDINGDGARNDRAFIYNPAAAPDTAIANGMARLIQRAPGSVRDCLRAQLGALAGRNSCMTGWQPSFDLQANLRPDLGKALGGRRMTLMFTLVNPLAGLDRALHGDNVRGWGQQSRPDPTLLFVRGFDQSTQRYLYQVNENFGDTRGSRTAIRTPFQIGFQARVQIGPDRQRDQLLGALGRGGQNGRGAQGQGARGGARTLRDFDVRQVVERVVPDPIAPILDRADSLHLTPTQVTSLHALSDSLRLYVDSTVDRVQHQVDSAGTTADLRTVFPRIQPELQRARDRYAATLKSAEKLLTPEQWKQLPDAVRNPPAIGQGQRGGQGGGQRPPD